MNKLFKTFTVIVISMVLLWLYIANCLYWNDYEWVYSNHYLTSAWQRILDGLWTISVFFGWAVWVCVTGLMFVFIFPNLKK